MTHGTISIVLSLLLIGAAQQQQQQSQPSIPDAPPPAGLSDLKDQVTPGSGAKASSPQGNPQDKPPQDQPPQQQAAPANAPAEQDNFQQPTPDTKGPGEKGYTIVQNVNYVDVPVTVRDKKGNLVPGLTWRQFKVFEDGQRQRIAFFTVDPYPLSVAFVIDQSLPSDVMKKVNNSLAALQGAFSPADTIAVFTYNTTPEMMTDFTASQGPRLVAVLDRSKKPGRDMGVPITGGPLATGMVINGQIPDPNVSPQRNSQAGFLVAPRASHPLNDAILYAAKALSKQEKGRRRIIYVITDGKEAGSKASLKEVTRYLLTNNISVYGTLVGDSATWGIGYLDKLHLPLLPTNNIMPKYALATGGSLDAELSENGIQVSFGKIIESVRTQYNLGYYSHNPAISEKHHTVEVQVTVPGLDVTAKEGYWPSMASMTP